MPTRFVSSPLRSLRWLVPVLLFYSGTLLLPNLPGNSSVAVAQSATPAAQRAEDGLLTAAEIH
ncbi:MAG TPA: hypothetical protein V6C57_24675 [Coleofasciculaceae cyanobacterium]